MESFIEVTFILDALIVFTSHLLTAFWCPRQIALWQIFISSLISVLFVCLFWYPFSGLIQFFLELAALYWIFQNYLKAYFVTLGFRFLFFFTFYQLIGGSFHNGYWFVPSIDNSWIFWSIFLVLLNLMLIHSWGKRMQKNEFLYFVSIRNEYFRFHCWGFLDTGNTAEFAAIPIIFINKKILPKCSSKINYQEVPIMSINATSSMHCILSTINIKGLREQSVYLSIAEHLEPSCLLNRKLFTMR